MVVQKGKVGTKGQKQILQENAETLKFYMYMSLGSAAIYLLAKFLVFVDHPTLDTVLCVLSCIVLQCCYKFMSSMATPKVGCDGTILDEGCDLNIEGGIAEHIKDLIILTSATLLLSMISSYFWLLWLLAPAQAFRLLWINILGPYFFQEGVPEETDERTEKKRRKMERRMRFQS